MKKSVRVVVLLTLEMCNKTIYEWKRLLFTTHYSLVTIQEEENPASCFLSQNVWKGQASPFKQK